MTRAIPVAMKTRFTNPVHLDVKVTSQFVPKPILCETACRSEDRLQNHPSIRDEHHKEAQHGAQDHGRDLAVLDVYPDEHDALHRQDRGSQDRQRRLPMEHVGDDEPDRAHEL